MKILLFLGFLVYTLFYIGFMTIKLRDFIITKIRNTMIYNDQTFFNRNKVIAGDWDSLLYGKWVRRFPLLFSLFKLKNLLSIICFPILTGVFGIMAFGVAPAHTKADGVYNANILWITILCSYAFSIIVIVVHALCLRRYKDIASGRKGVAETKQILQKADHI